MPTLPDGEADVLTQPSEINASSASHDASRRGRASEYSLELFDRSFLHCLLDLTARR